MVISPREPGRSGLRITRSLVVPESELQWKFSASGGPGGQHANTANTRADVRFDVEASEALGPVQRQRILTRLGPVVRVSASDERSQARNRALAAGRLAEKLRDALRIDPPRRATKPSVGATERRLGEKARRGSIKAQRRARPDAD